MKKQVALTTLLFITISLMAQKNKNREKDNDTPAFGKVENSDLQMKDCDFDDKAEAVVLSLRLF